MPKFPALFLTMAALSLGLAACGGSSSTSTSSSAAAAAPAAATSSAAAQTSSSSPAPASGALKVAAASSGMLMFSTTSLTAKAGKVTISFTNMAPEKHNFTLQKGTSGPVVGATPTFSGGTKALTVDLKPGTYTYYCSVPGHRMGGMQGTLTVS